MAEPGDDELSRRYRALAREEPPAALDAAILASSRRAVGARPGGARRWAGPVSIAAVLVLGIGVTLRMQHERPGIETSAPISEYQRPETSPEAPAATLAVKPDAAPPAAVSETAPAPLVKKSAPAPARREAPSQLADVAPPAATVAPASPPMASITAPVATPPPPAPAAPAMSAAPAAAPLARRDPAPEQTSRDAISERGARDASGEAAVAPRAKREAASANEARVPGAQSESPAEALERIARLRAEARHAEADKALEEFRRRYPDYRIPESTWERVRPR